MKKDQAPWIDLLIKIGTALSGCFLMAQGMIHSWRNFAKWCLETDHAALALSAMIVVLYIQYKFTNALCAWIFREKG